MTAKPSVAVGMPAGAGAVSASHAMASAASPLTAALLELYRSSIAISDPTEDDMSIASLTTQLAALTTQVDANTAAIATFQTGGLHDYLILDAQHDFACRGDNSFDDRANAQAALDAAGAAYLAGVGKVAVFFMPGRYILGRNGFKLLSIPAGVQILGVPGATWWVQQAGMPNQSTVMALVDGANGVGFFGMGFDGNWGAIAGVTNSQAGINHTTQTDPKNHGIFVKGGSTGITISNCKFQQIYGDAMEFGNCHDVVIERVSIDTTARNGISLIGKCDPMYISRVNVANVYTTAIDTEPNTDFGAVVDVTIDHCKLGGWWLPSPVEALSITGSQAVRSPSSECRGFRVHNSTILGSVAIQTSHDVVIRDTRITLDSADVNRAPLYIDHGNNNLHFENLEIYDRGSANGAVHDASIVLAWYGARNKPVGATFRGVRIKSRNGRNGMQIDGVGSASTPYAGTATGVTATSLTDAAASGWVTNGFAGQLVRMGGVLAAIESNTTTVLTVAAWETGYGVSAATPAAGAYEILCQNGVVLLDDVQIDCSDDGNGHGGLGVYIDAGDFGAVAGGTRIKIRDLLVRNAQGDAVQIQSRNAANPIKHLELVDIHAIDDQAVATCTNAVKFNGTAPVPCNITKCIIRGITTEGVANALAGVGAASPNLTRWLVHDGAQQEWEGYGAPSFTAPAGSRFWRRDPVDGNTLLYVNAAGGSTWIAK